MAEVARKAREPSESRPWSATISHSDKGCKMTPTNSIKALAVFVFLAGGVASALLTFLLAFFFTLDYPSAHARRESTLLLFIPLLLVFLCPAPLFWGTVLSLFRNCQRLGIRLTLAGSVLLTIYLELGYAT